MSSNGGKEADPMDAALPPTRKMIVVDILAAGWALILAFLAGIMLGFAAAVVLLVVMPG